MLTLYLTSRKVLVLKEKEAFSFTSLVADIGGVLGLFIVNWIQLFDDLGRICISNEKMFVTKKLYALFIFQ